MIHALHIMRNHKLAPAALALLALAFPGMADAKDGKAPHRTRIGLGAQFTPSYPGSDQLDPLPLGNFSRVRGDKLFAFSAPDQSAGLSLVKKNGLEIGPAFSFQGKRTARDVGAPLDKVNTTVEAGAFVQYSLSPMLRVRAEARRGLGGHDGWVGSLAADYVARKGDSWLFSIGPRISASDSHFQRAYFGVTPAESVRAAVPAFRPDGGAHAVGAAASLLTQFTKRWGIYSYAKYDRLIGDAGRSPVTRRFGSRDQFSGGLALTYTFGGRRSK